jgi:hypothetical protein
MTPEEILAVMGTAPVDKTAESGVEEWRYCETRLSTDVFVVFYLHKNRVVEKATYTVNPVIQSSDGTPDTRVGESCRDTVSRIYWDRRMPPRRVRELREHVGR